MNGFRPIDYIPEHQMRYALTQTCYEEYLELRRLNLWMGTLFYTLGLIWNKLEALHRIWISATADNNNEIVMICKDYYMQFCWSSVMPRRQLTRSWKQWCCCRFNCCCRCNCCCECRRDCCMTSYKVCHWRKISDTSEQNIYISTLTTMGNWPSSL